MTSLHPTVAAVTERIIERSKDSRARYLEHVAHAKTKKPARFSLGCTNLAHGLAAAPSGDKIIMQQERPPNIGIITSYNDMLSAHSPYGRYPDMIKATAREFGATAQVAGATPAMCDGVTQGEPGMEMSLFSRDLIAMSTAIALSHNVFDGALYLGICDKIVPGLLIGALRFGHLPAIFVPSGPMASGISNSDKAKVRQRYAEGKADRDELLESEMAAYHSEGTCTFYGTANSNQMLMELMGLHIPGAAFVPPYGNIRDALTNKAVEQIIATNASGKNARPIADIIDEKVIVNGIVGLLATGGSTNHTLHLVAIARAAGIDINWTDFSDLSASVPLLARVYPNGPADINQFHAAGGVATVTGELLKLGALHNDVKTVVGDSLDDYVAEPYMQDETLQWRPAAEPGVAPDIIASAENPFSPEGGMQLLQGNLGRAVIKVSAVQKEHQFVEAACRIFETQESVQAAFKAGEFTGDMVLVVRFQGPKANGMPELHKLMPVLGVLQDRGHSVALVTDGRLSGASGKVPSAIHATPECLAGGPLGKLQDGDIVRLDCSKGELVALVDDETWAKRDNAKPVEVEDGFGFGRELFQAFRLQAGDAEAGACVFNNEVQGLSK